MAVVTIGNFDGCHLGHQDLLGQTLRLGKILNQSETIGISFYPRPEAYFRGIEYEPLLTTTSQKRRIFSEFGIDRFECLPFNASMAQLTANEFVEEILIKQFECQHLVVGEDFHFGKGREGSTKWLLDRAKIYELVLHSIPIKKNDHKKISSSAIRKLLSEEGDTSSAITMLGRPYLVEGNLVKGAQLGRKIGFPTFNLQSKEQVLPKNGVYAGYVWINRSKISGAHPTLLRIDEEAEAAIINVGYRPTVSSEHIISIEAHLLDGFSQPLLSYFKDYGDFYNVEAGFYFLDRIREEKKFAGLDALKEQIALDCKIARGFLRR
jgi:riboflavin kinase/FMN adenylyltransferase